MKTIFLLSYFIFASMMYAKEETAPLDCSMQIKKVDHTSETYTLVITHDKRCEILMDHNTSHINLVSKEYEDVPSDTIEQTSNTASTKIDELILLAKSKLGDSYEAEKAGPDHFDCSGFVYFLFKSSGINIPRSSLNQSKIGNKLTRSELEKGDILFFDTHHRDHINHSGVYLGDGKFIHSSSGKAYAVTVSALDKGFYSDKFRWGVRKIEK